MTSILSLLDDLDEKSQNVQSTYYFEAEILQMMFACGDSSKPSKESAHLIEKIVHQQLISALLQAQEVAEMREAKYIRTEDILFLMRKDKMKLRRAIKFLCYSDLRNSVLSSIGPMATSDPLNTAGGGGKRRQICKDFLMSMDCTGQLLSWVDDDSVADEVKEERMQRSEQQANSMSSEDYLAFSQARGLSFTQSNNTHSLKLREWLFSEGHILGDSSRPQLPIGHGIHMEILGYVAYETLAQIIDFALLVRRDAKALSTDPLNRLMPPSLFAPVVTPAPRSSLSHVSQQEENKSKSKLEGTPPLTPHEIREAVRRYWNPISIFNVGSRNMQSPMDRQLFCK